MIKTKIKKAMIILALAICMSISLSGVNVLGGKTAITAEAATAKKVVVSKETVSVAVAGKTTVQLKNTDAKKKVTWSSSNKKVATVKKGSNGKATITGKKAGTAKIIAKYDGKKYTIKVTVKTPTLSKKSLSLSVGKKSTLTLSNTVNSKKITWQSSKTSVATVKAGKNGKVTVIAQQVGTASITATYNGKKYTCKVTVNAQAIAPGLNKTSLSLAKGQSDSITLNNVVSSKKVTAKSSNTKVATVVVSSNKVTITAIAKGNCTVTVSHNGKNYKCSVTVTGSSTIKEFNISAPEGSYLVYNSSTIIVKNRDCYDGVLWHSGVNASSTGILYTENDYDPISRSGNIYDYSRGSYVGRYSYCGKIYDVYTIVKTKSTSAEQKANEKFVEDFMNNYASKCTTDLAKVLSIPIYFIDSGIYYATGGTGAYSLRKNWVCGDYANATYQLCRAMGIPSAVVSSRSVNHAWAQVYVNGKWCIFDTVTPTLEGDTFESQFLNYENDSKIRFYWTGSKPPVAKEGLGYYFNLKIGVMYDYSSTEVFYDAWVNDKFIPIPGWGL